MIRVAVDVQVGPGCCQELRGYGIEVVVRARELEADDAWFARAALAGVDAIVSPDRDLGKLCRRAIWPVVWVQLPSDAFTCAEVAEWIEIALDPEFQRPMPPPPASRQLSPDECDEMRAELTGKLHVVATFLRTRPRATFTPDAMRQRLELPAAIVRGAIRQLVRDGKVVKIPPTRPRAEPSYTWAKVERLAAPLLSRSRR